MKNNFITAEFLRAKRTRLKYKNLRRIKERKAKKKIKKFIYVNNKQMHIDAFKTILKLKKNPTNKKQTIKFTVGSNFSLYDDPNRVLKAISEVSHINDNKNITNLKIDHSKCEENELGAELLLATVVKSIATIREFNNGSIHVQGIYPKNTKVSRLINSIGVVKEIANSSTENIPKEKLKIFRRMRVTQDKINKQAGDIKSRTVQDFVEFIDKKCLLEVGRSFTFEGQDNLINYIGEIIDNAQEHSGKPDWHIYGYFDSTVPENMNVEIVIYNLGYTIAETFTKKRDIPEVFDLIKKYINKHQNRSFSEELLITVAALQQSNSSKLDLDPSRGKGTVDLIKFFFQVAKECCYDNNEQKAKMYMISGAANIKFDDTFSMHTDDEGYAIMPFNKEKSLDFPPDSRYVSTLKDTKFPGTIIGIQFPIGKNSTIISKSDDYEND